ncbi:bifunctional oligoribonuclease/PAP phosphatase NrnA [bacterium]|nr:bifunctional oligoribonuclease/PAP phosphatase NrnA [bacterium]MCI0606633.1 bifunctional oligoribonuclease/PAP phosphatase NrnA [bacterium]
MSLTLDMSFSKDWESIREIVQNNGRFLITTHVNADPDALGSEIALAEGLRALNKEVVIVNPTGISRHFSFLDPEKRVQEYNKDEALANCAFDAVFIVDISRWERLGLLADPLRYCGKPKVCIDHHPYTGGFSDYHLVNVNACASAEIIFDLLNYLDIPLTKQIAESIYVSILADTGAFTFSNTNARTHQIVSALLSYGICPRTLYESLYQNHTPERLKFLGKVLGSLQFDCDQRLAYVTVSHTMLQENGMTPDDLEGFVDMPRNCRSVLLSILFAEVAPDDVKISLRSKGEFHSNKIALLFGGGGHSHASGIRLSGNLQSIEEMVLAEARKGLGPYLKKNCAVSA